MRIVDKSAEDMAEIWSLIIELEKEHEGAGQILKRMIKETEDFTPPDYACSTMKVVYAKLHELTDDLFLHIAKENSVLFKRFE